MKMTSPSNTHTHTATRDLIRNNKQEIRPGSISCLECTNLIGPNSLQKIDSINQLKSSVRTQERTHGNFQVSHLPRDKKQI